MARMRKIMTHMENKYQPKYQNILGVRKKSTKREITATTTKENIKLT